MAANLVTGVRAALAWNPEIAKLARKAHTHALLQVAAYAEAHPELAVIRGASYDGSLVDGGAFEARGHALYEALGDKRVRLLTAMRLLQDAGLKVDHLTRDAWQSPNKQPAPPVL